jgi:hypothetical protein
MWYEKWIGRCSCFVLDLVKFWKSSVFFNTSGRFLPRSISMHGQVGGFSFRMLSSSTFLIVFIPEHYGLHWPALLDSNVALQVLLLGHKTCGEIWVGGKCKPDQRGSVWSLYMPERKEASFRYYCTFRYAGLVSFCGLLNFPSIARCAYFELTILTVLVFFWLFWSLIIHRNS